METVGSGCYNIVQLLDWFELPDSFMLVMERPEQSRDLLHILLEQEFLSEEAARWLFCQVLNAVGHCTACGVLHRDIKPSNLLVNPETGELKLIDFGCGTFLQQRAFTAFAGEPRLEPCCLCQALHGPIPSWAVGCGIQPAALWHGADAVPQEPAAGPAHTGGLQKPGPGPWAWRARKGLGCSAGLLCLAERVLGFGRWSGGCRVASGGRCGQRCSSCLWQEGGTRLWKPAACAWPAAPVSPRNTAVQPTRVDRPWLLPRPWGDHLVPGCAAVRHGLRRHALPRGP